MTSSSPAISTADGVSRVTIADPSGTVIVAPLLEIGPAQALIKTDAEFEANAYLDLTLELKGQPPRKFFAHVVGPEPTGLRIRWMHLDPGEEQKLKGLLAAYARTSAVGHGSGHGTRRVIKPRTDTYTPFAGGGEVELPAAPTIPPAGPRGTRRLIKPGARGASGDEAEPTQAAPGEESRGHPVVIATTDRFDRLKHLDDVAIVKPSKPADQPASEGVAVPTPGRDQSAVDPFPEPDKDESSSSRTSASGRTATVNKDGRMDVGAAIRSKAKTVRASDLAARHDKVRVLNMSTIKTLIQEAVEEAAAHLTRALGEAERKRLLEEAEEGFKERLKAFEIDKKSAEEKARVLQNDLKAATSLLEQERKRSIAADQFTVSESGLAEIDERMAKIIERSVQRGEAGPDLELKLREMIAKILDSEREKMREKELSAHNDKIALLEKKVNRLAHSLDETEKERDEARQIAELMEKQGLTITDVKNKYRIGLAGDDPNKERKLALMRELLEQNRELRRQLGIKLRDPAEAAREAQEEAKRAREEAAQAKAEALADSAQPAAAAPAPAPAVEPVAETESDPVADTGEPQEDPDDQPWEAPAAVAAPAADQEDDRGVKVLRSYKKFEPPPLESEAAADSGDDVEVAINPDDQPWEAPPEKAPEAPSGGAVKRVAAVQKAPPPLRK